MTTHSHIETNVYRGGHRAIGLHDLLSLWRQRQALRRLDARALDDLGLSHRAVRTEARRPFWDLPGHMRG